MADEIFQFQIITGSADETVALGKRIGRNLKKGDVLALFGELGSGKTCFTEGLARGLGVHDSYPITSPTFTLINEYPAKFTLYHFDAYRLTDFSELENLGYDEYFSGNGVVVIEWAQKIAQAIPADALFVDFEHIDENRRKITLKGLPDKMKTLVEDIRDGG